ncbi:unnamed protein product [Closterium sp. NIES-54]
MGHVALPILQQLVKNEMVSGIRVKGEPDEVLGCLTCMQAKFTRYPFSSSEATAKAPLDEVVMDVVGPLKLGASGAEYFLTIVDVYTRMTWVYVLSKKRDVAETVKTDWLPMVEWQQDRLVKAIRADRGGEFLSKATWAFVPHRILGCFLCFRTRGHDKCWRVHLLCWWRPNCLGEQEAGGLSIELDGVRVHGTLPCRTGDCVAAALVG